MSSHRRRVKHFARESGPRKALLRGLMESLVEHGRITTTVDRAKEVKRHIEKAITLGKKGDLATTRLLMSRLSNKSAVTTIVKDLSVRFKSRPGGYTRIIKIGRRPGDTAEMAFLEFVDYDFETVASESEVSKKDAKVAVTLKKVAKAKKNGLVAKKKAIKKSQKKARSTARA